MYILVGKVIFISILATFFLKYFGYPSLVKYYAQQTIMIEENVKFKTNDPPAITIATMQLNIEHGWKDDSDLYDIDMIVETFCNKSENINDCINDKTFKLSEVVEKAQNGYDSSDFWSEDISNFYYGKTYTLSKPYKIGSFKIFIK